MKKYIIMAVMTLSMVLSGYREAQSDRIIRFATSAEYPPFEYYENGAIRGFDIDLAQLIAIELKKEAVFEDMKFGSILAALQSGTVDAAIATMTATEERKKNFDFSNSYHIESIALIYPKNMPLTSSTQLPEKKIACQLGTTMEIWLKKHVPSARISSMDSNTQAIEALKAGHVDGVLIDKTQAVAFAQKNSTLSYSVIAKSDAGYGIAIKKGSPLKEQIDDALKILENNGALDKLKKKWFENEQWKN